jgi:beta-glucanase (GH16 family)
MSTTFILAKTRGSLVFVLKKSTASGLLALACLAACGGVRSSTGNTPDGSANWSLTWSDEFDLEAGKALDDTRWGFDVGGNGWGNGQLEYNSDRLDNASHDGEGNLAIVARREAFGENQYTSARIITRGRFEQAYGRFEARIQLPRGQGIWPAFWLLGGNFGTVGWPQCGEIDIMEFRGQEPWKIAGSLHGPAYSGATPVSKTYTLPGTGDFSDGFHVFRVDWNPQSISWFVDGYLFQSVALSSLPGEPVFDHPFFIILNVAVGGGYVGSPDGSTVFPQTMKVDYVRVYEPSP